MSPPDDEPPLPTLTDLMWRSAIEARWEALRRAVLRLDSTERRKLSDLGQECQRIAAVVAWLDADRNITRTAANLASNRRSIREHLLGWLRGNPWLVPSPSNPKRSSTSSPP